MLLVVAAFAVPRIISRRPAATPPAEAGSPTAPPKLEVQVIQLVPRRLEERLSTTGTLRANEEIDVVAEISGVVRSLHFDEGTAVHAGDLLVKIDDSELSAQRDRIRAQLALAETLEARQRELREQGIVSDTEYDVAFSELAVLRTELRLIEVRLQKSEIRAPFSGVVGLRRVSEGTVLSPQTVITTLQDLDPVKVDFTLPESHSGRVGPGSRVEVRVRGVERPFQAEVYAVRPGIDPETRSLVLRARAPNPGHLLRPGAFADVTLAVSEAKDSLVVPSIAVVPELGGRKVFVVQDGLAQPRRVETGIRTDTEIEIVSGLAPGDRVIVSAIQRLRPGLPVEPRPAAGP